MTEHISTDRSFNATQQQMLSVLADLMIPPHGDLPGAADETIFAEVLAELGERQQAVVRGLDGLGQLCNRIGGAPLAELSPDQQMSAVNEMRKTDSAFLRLFENEVLACYYRDDRVLESLGLPARAPYPQGYEVPASDWGLLDPVRKRQPFYVEVAP